LHDITSEFNLTCIFSFQNKEKSHIVKGSFAQIATLYIVISGSNSCYGNYITVGALRQVLIPGGKGMFCLPQFYLIILFPIKSQISLVPQGFSEKIRFTYDTDGHIGSIE